MPSSEPIVPPANGMWIFELKTLEDLRLSYLSWVVQGGLFLPMSAAGLTLGQEGMLLGKLPDGPPRLGLLGRVVWITPSLTDINRPEGIGVAFVPGPSAVQAQSRIEQLLGPALADMRPTWTM